MSSYVGPNGRIYKSERRSYGFVWVLISIAIIAAIVAGFSDISDTLTFAGL
jgi:hypothetical protein